MQETVLVFTLDEITAIRLDCACGASMAMDPGATLSPRLQCIQCNAALVSDPTIFSIVAALFYGLKIARAFNGGPFSLRLTLKT